MDKGLNEVLADSAALRSDCADAQADLELHCPHKACDKMSSGSEWVNLIIPFNPFPAKTVFVVPNCSSWSACASAHYDLRATKLSAYQ